MPFEFVGWDGPADVERIQLDIEADFTLHPDVSRAFAGDGHLNPGYSHALPYLAWPSVAERRELARNRFPDVTADVEPGDVPVGEVDWMVHIETPVSHPGMANHLRDFAVEDLRVYGAVFDGEGRVIDVTVGAIYGFVLESDDDGNVRYHQKNSDMPLTRLIDVISLPTAEELVSLHASFEVFPELPELGGESVAETAYSIEGKVWDHTTEAFLQNSVVRSGGFIIWIGAAHP